MPVITVTGKMRKGICLVLENLVTIAEKAISRFMNDINA
jgi:hypothetical protein